MERHTPKSVTFRQHDHLVSVLLGELLSHSYSVTNVFVSCENMFLALQDGAPPVMSLCIIIEIWLHKGGYYQKHFRERTTYVLS